LSVKTAVVKRRKDYLLIAVAAQTEDPELKLTLTENIEDKFSKACCTVAAFAFHAIAAVVC
jgi:hypothetical protein